jgi:hypothetical protein
MLGERSNLRQLGAWRSLIHYSKQDVSALQNRDFKYFLSNQVALASIAMITVCKSRKHGANL